MIIQDVLLSKCLWDYVAFSSDLLTPNSCIEQFM